MPEAPEALVAAEPEGEAADVTPDAAALEVAADEAVPDAADEAAALPEPCSTSNLPLWARMPSVLGSTKLMTYSSSPTSEASGVNEYEPAEVSMPSAMVLVEKGEGIWTTMSNESGSVLTDCGG